MQTVAIQLASPVVQAGGYIYYRRGLDLNRYSREQLYEESARLHELGRVTPNDVDAERFMAEALWLRMVITGTPFPEYIEGRC